MKRLPLLSLFTAVIAKGMLVLLVVIGNPTNARASSCAGWTSDNGAYCKAYGEFDCNRTGENEGDCMYDGDDESCSCS